MSNYAIYKISILVWTMCKILAKCPLITGLKKHFLFSSGGPENCNFLQQNDKFTPFYCIILLDNCKFYSNFLLEYLNLYLKYT